MDIDFVVRSDAQVKSGGDSIQVEEYRSELQMRGHDVRVIPFSPSMSLRKTAVIHFVNLDRPFDYLVGSSLAAGQPRVISPIHHDLQRIRLMRRNERGYGFRSLIGRFLPENGREFLAFFVRGLIADRSIRGRMQLVKASLSVARHIPGIWARVGVELNRMDRVLQGLGRQPDRHRADGRRQRVGSSVPHRLTSMTATSGDAGSVPSQPPWVLQVRERAAPQC